MIMARALVAMTPPLFVWHELQEIETLAAERAALKRRIAQLPRHAHRRVVLEARLAETTARQLALEAAIGRSI